ncbi:hypothetical protein ABIC12_002796 [Pantoea agglomerans]|uniref:hypothetical protein n=1 Tax=Enterobacter agglomerans TaxID=549 RepID=UPI0013BB8F31|nr:hypothetical protein [Pantoea agglomerans]MDQ0430934.1 hypothetical protein [Pantoea agglomerans]NEG84898.1 hypothetical protein [Pantoea agglomerans]NEH09077.1 hypothetical protein [Pantoea agglomerans]
MNSMSKAQLDDYLAKNCVATDWGGLMAFRTDSVNKILKSAFEKMMSELKIMSPITGNVDYSGLGLDDARFNLYTGCPVISFKNAALPNARATIIFPVIAGTYDYIKKTDITFPYLAESRHIEEESGYSIEFDIQFKINSDTSRKKGTLVIDLSEATVCRCNLATTETGTCTLGSRILEKIKTLDKGKVVIEIASLDYSGYDATAPKSARVVTQKSPDNLGVNPDEGCLIVLMQLTATKNQGGLPVEPFPYLLPNDRQGNAYRYDAVHYLTESCYKYFSLTGHLTFVNYYSLAGNACISVDETEKTEGNRASNIVFLCGNVTQNKDALTIRYQKLNFAPGESHQFSAWLGSKPSYRAAWALHNLNGLSASETISSEGIFTAPASGRMTSPVFQYVLTATTTDATSGKTQQDAVVYRVKNHSSLVSPQFATAFRGAGELCFRLNTDEKGPITWTLSDVTMGTLQPDGKTVRYTPPSGKISSTRLILSASSAGKSLASATILLKDKSSELEIDPPYHSSFTNETVHFSLPDNAMSRLLNIAERKAGRTVNLSEVSLKWSLIGPGRISDKGVYTPDASEGETATVVRLRVTGPSINFEGTSVVRITPCVAPKKWTDLAAFEIKPLFSEARAFRNGYQQIPVQIEITTKIVDDEYYPITAAELSTLELVSDGGNNNPVPFIDPDMDGIDSEFGSVWAVNTRENRYLFNNMSAKSLLPLASTPGTVSRRFYIHTTATTPQTFYARFRDSNGFLRNSTDKEFNGTEFSTITLIPLTTANPISKDYEVISKRVAGGGEAGSDNSAGGQFENDDFDFHLKTSDYWRIKYVPQSGWTRFMTIEFKDNTSIMQWESEQLAETMFSSTSYFFLPADRVTPLPERYISYDYRLLDVISDENERVTQKLDNSEPEVPGELLIILDRFDEVSYLHKHPLNRGMIVYLRDEYGNMHSMSINFASKANRNQLSITPGI